MMQISLDGKLNLERFLTRTSPSGQTSRAVVQHTVKMEEGMTFRFILSKENLMTLIQLEDKFLIDMLEDSCSCQALHYTGLRLKT